MELAHPGRSIPYWPKYPVVQRQPNSVSRDGRGRPNCRRCRFQPVAAQRREQPQVNTLFFQSDFREDRVQQRKQTRLAIKEAAGEDLIWFDAAV
jgi:hypothetical protein